MKKSLAYKIILIIAQFIALFCVLLPLCKIDFGFVSKSLCGLDFLLGNISDLLDFFADFSTDNNSMILIIKASIICPCLVAVIGIIISFINAGNVACVFAIFHAVVHIVCYGLWAVVIKTTDTGIFDLSKSTYTIIVIGFILLAIGIVGFGVDDEKTKSARNAELQDKNVTVMGNGKGALLGVMGEYKGVRIPLEQNTPLIIGRDSNVANLVISEPEVSRMHCSINYNSLKGTYQICVFSDNGVMKADGTVIAKDNAEELKSGSLILIGGEKNIFQLG